MSIARAFLFFTVAAAIVYAASGCSGGGGTSSAPPPVAPSVCPSPETQYPPLDCSQYELSGSTAQTITRFYPAPVPPPLVTNISVQQQITVHDNKMFHGTNATDFHTLEIDTGPNQVITITSDVYLVFPQQQNGQIVNLGFHSTDSNGVILDVQNGAGNGVVGLVPLPNNGGWANNASQTVSETDPDGTVTNLTFNNDGTYTLVKNEVAGQTNACDNPDGSGSANIPSTTFFAAAGSTNVAVTAPGVGNQVTIELSGVEPSPVPVPIPICAPSPSPTPTPVLVAPPVIDAFKAWYPLPVQLANDQTTIEGTTAIPANCTPLAANGTQLHEVKSSVDPVFGTTDSQVNDTWVAPSLGPVCQSTSDLQQIFYDFSGQSNPILLGQLAQTTQSTELLGVTNAQRALSLQRSPSTRAEACLPFEVAVALAHVRYERTQILAKLRLLRALTRHANRGIWK